MASFRSTEKLSNHNFSICVLFFSLGMFGLSPSLPYQGFTSGDAQGPVIRRHNNYGYSQSSAGWEMYNHWWWKWGLWSICIGQGPDAQKTINITGLNSWTSVEFCWSKRPSHVIYTWQKVNGYLKTQQPGKILWKSSGFVSNWFVKFLLIRP